MWTKAAPRMTPDSELASAEAITFRIERIKSASNGVLTPADARRIQALRLRLPADPSKPLAAPVSHTLLLSKKDLDWEGRKPQLYA